MKKCFFSLLLAAIIFVPFTTNAQVTIGSGRAPSEWSLLYLDATEQPKALHLPRMTTDERNALVAPVPEGGERRELERGLMIFNTSNNCLEFWSGTHWISLCVDALPWLEVNPGDYTFPTEGSTRIFNVDTSASTWTVHWINADGTPAASEPDGFTLVYNIANNRFTVTAASNQGGVRTGTIRVEAGLLYEEIDIIQLPGDGSEFAAAMRQAFVGAFWRENQQGERLIRIHNPHAAPNDNWTAIAMDDWILLCSEPSTATGLGTRNFENPELPQHRLDPDSPTVGSSVSGRGEIRFRIGLDGTIGTTGTIQPDAANPTPNATVSDGHYTHRWGRVMVLHNNGTEIHMIWIRQGEDSHYVMQVGDPGSTQRNTTNVRRWSAFNVNSVAHTSIQFSSSIPLRNAAGTGGGGIFTVYPSWAGIVQRWATSVANNNTYNGRRARATWVDRVNNTNAFVTGANVSPSVTTHGSTWWSIGTLNNNPNNANESCPPGYRRPGGWEVQQSHQADGANVGVCEWRQSLRLGARMFAGALADGFYDRRIPPEGNIPSSVDILTNLVGGGTFQSTGGNNIATIGMIVVNPYRFYHIFLPMSGYIMPPHGNNANVRGVGWVGRYWTSAACFGSVGGTHPNLTHTTAVQGSVFIPHVVWYATGGTATFAFNEGPFLAYRTWDTTGRNRNVYASIRCVAE